MAVRHGFSIPLPALPVKALRPVLERAPDWGYTDVWTAESSGADGFTPLALAAAWAPGLRLGTSVVPAQTRGPAVLAMTAATLAHANDGGVVLGIGSSGPPFVEYTNGIPFGRPYPVLRDTARFLRGAFAGEHVSGTFESFTIRGFQLADPPAPRPRLMLGALRPGMLKLAAREADGAITNVLTAADVTRVAKEFRAAAPGGELVGRFFVCPTADRRAARAMGRRILVPMLNAQTYSAFHDWLGRGELLAPMRAAWALGDWAGAQAALPDSLLDELFVHGSPQACREQLARFAEAGLDTVISVVLPAPEFGPGPAGAMAALEALGPHRT